MPVIDRMDDAGKAVGFFVDNLHLEDLNPINCGWHQRDSPVSYTHLTLPTILLV